MSLLMDELMELLFQLVASNFSWFYATMIPKLVARFTENDQRAATLLIESLGSPTDYPTFALNMTAFRYEYCRLLRLKR